MNRRALSDSSAEPFRCKPQKRWKWGPQC